MLGGGGGKADAGGAAQHSAHSVAPNVLVAHLEEGIEAVHLYSGRTLCKLHLPSPGLHADLNGDGVLDHVQVSFLEPLFASKAWRRGSHQGPAVRGGTFICRVDWCIVQ